MAKDFLDRQCRYVWFDLEAGSDEEGCTKNLETMRLRRPKVLLQV